MGTESFNIDNLIFWIILDMMMVRSDINFYQWNTKTTLLRIEWFSFTIVATSNVWVRSNLLLVIVFLI